MSQLDTWEVDMSLNKSIFSFTLHQAALDASKMSSEGLFQKLIFVSTVHINILVAYIFSYKYELILPHL